MRIQIVNRLLKLLYKKCSCCELVLKLSEFSPRKDSKDGYRDKCRVCSIQVRKIRATRNKDRNISKIADANSTKKCSRCLSIKEVSEFQKSYTRKDGIHPYCAECVSIISKARYHDNKEEICNKVKQYREDNLEKVKAKTASYKKSDKGKIVIRKSCEKRRALKFSTTISGIDTAYFASTRYRCFWCGRLHNGIYHIDHFYSLSRGGSHTLDNIVVSCPSCNLKKHVKDPEIFAKEIGRDSNSMFEEDVHNW